MSDVPQEIRREAAILARRRKARSSAFSPDAPTDWRPQTVLNPVVDGDYFTPDGAWEFIAERLEDENQVVEWIELNKPPGKKALVMIISEDPKDIYIKVQLGSGKINGRSFHYSDVDRT